MAPRSTAIALLHGTYTPESSPEDAEQRSTVPDGELPEACSEFGAATDKSSRPGPGAPIPTAPSEPPSVFPSKYAKVSAPLEERTKVFFLDLCRTFRPTTDEQRRLVLEMGSAMAHSEQLMAAEIANINRISREAATSWNKDRRKRAAALGARLPRDPSRVVPALRRTKHGVDWLLRRWGYLSRSVRYTDHLDEDERLQVFDLLGIPKRARKGSNAVPAGTDTAALAALIGEQIETLSSLRRYSLKRKDRCLYEIALSGMSFEAPDAETKQLERDKASADRRFDRARIELFRLQGRSRSGRR